MSDNKKTFLTFSAGTSGDGNRNIPYAFHMEGILLREPYF